MAKKLNLFKPALFAPVGLNNFTGEVFECFTRGDTLPFKFVLRDVEGNVPVDVDQWKVFIIMANMFAPERGDCDEEQIKIEIEIPLTDSETGTFEGDVTGIETQVLPSGSTYAMAKYVTAPNGNVPGKTHIIDMCTLEVYPNLSIIQ